jgi:hypothetical protein
MSEAPKPVTPSRATAPITPLRGTGATSSLRPEPANWNKWKHIPKAALWKVVCLTLDIEPDEEKHNIRNWLQWRHGVPFGFPVEMADRLDIAQANMSTNGPIHPPMYVVAMNNPHADVLLSEVAAAALSWGWAIPDAMRTLAQAGAPASEPRPASKAPALLNIPKSSPRDHRPWETLPDFYEVVEGVYLYQQAAREIADSLGWSDDQLTALLEGMIAAINAEELPTCDRKTGMRCPRGKPEFLSLVNVDDVNAWLKRRGAKYQWTPLTPQRAVLSVAAPVVEVPVIEPVQSTAGPSFSMSKSGLIEAHKHEWMTIERDLKDASANGLSVAKAGPREWNEVTALEWARAKGKLRATDKPASELATALHSMSSLPSRKHRLEG